MSEHHRDTIERGGPRRAPLPIWQAILVLAALALALTLIVRPDEATASVEMVVEMVIDINPGPADGFATNPVMVAIGETAYFVAVSRLWKTDGTEGGTEKLSDAVIPGVAPPSGVPTLTDVDGTLYFASSINARLWKSDGTAAGTVLVKDIWPDCGSCPVLDWLTNVSGTLFFTAEDGIHGRELWRSDGTSDGTYMVKDLRVGSDSSAPSNLAVFNDVLFFSALDGISAGDHGRELWRSDGTPEGTYMVKDINPGTGTGGPVQLTVVGDTLFFSAVAPGIGRELWKSDGTEAGTVLVKDIREGSDSGLPLWLTEVGGTLLFTANDGLRGNELWKSDGTEAGTVLVKDIRDGLTSSSPNRLTAVGDTLFMAANDGLHGNELWRSDGGAGTFLVKDIRDGPDSSIVNPPPIYPDIAAVNGTLFFVANDDFIHFGRELYMSDGTRDGTKLVAKITKNDPPSESLPRALTNLNGTLLFVADDGVHGRELWKVTIAGANQPPVIEPIADMTIDEDTLIEITPVVSDPEDDPFTLSWEGVPAGAVANATFSWTPSEEQGPGDYDVTVTATQDSDPSLSTSVTFTITVLEVNAPPVLEAIGGQSVAPGEMLEFQATATDPDIPANSLTYSIDGVGGDLPDGATIDSNTGAFSWLACECAGDQYMVRVWVTDDGDPVLSDFEDVSIDVLPVGAPAADLGVTLSAQPDPAPAQTGSALVYTASVTNDGPDGATGVVLTVRLPGGVNLESVEPNLDICLVKGRNITCLIGDVDAGADPFVATIVIGTKGGSSLTADATVAGNEDDPDLANNSDSVTVSICRRDCP